MTNEEPPIPEEANREWVALWEEFIQRAKSRLESGSVEYGDESFGLPPIELVREIEEEILDVVAWSFILAVRIASVSKKLQE